jgi:hypothetical protein
MSFEQHNPYARSEQIERENKRRNYSSLSKEEQTMVSDSLSLLTELSKKGIPIELKDHPNNPDSFTSTEGLMSDGTRVSVRLPNGDWKAMGKIHFLDQAGLVKKENNVWSLNEEKYNYYLGLNTPKVDQSGT